MANHRMISLVVVGLLFAATLSDAHVGVLYGTKGDNLPAPKDVINKLVLLNNITRVRLIEPNKDILTALKGKNVEVLLGYPNEPILTPNETFAEKWVEENVKPYVHDVKIKYIVVGTDISANNEYSKYGFTIFEVMGFVHNALQKHCLSDIKVTISCDPSMIMQLSANFLPSTSVFLNESGTLMQNVTKFLSGNGAPLLVNLHPYYEFIKHPNDVRPRFALFNTKRNVLKDGNLIYQNKFDAMLDAFYTVLEKAGYPGMEIIVSETGWPSTGGVAATAKNQQTYITNLIKHLGKGTPKRPNKPLQVYLNLLDENQKGRCEIDKHMGLFTVDLKPKFPVVFA